MTHSAVYTGWVRHRRHAPVRNVFRYRLYMLYIDLAELPRLFRRTPLWSFARRDLAWFRREDYLGDSRRSLDSCVRDLVEDRTGRRPAGPIRMLTQVRTFGFVFNPVTFYYCFDESGEQVDTVVTDITNTPWGERFAYVHAPDENDGQGRRKRYRFPKSFHVSPFMRMAQDYDWRFVDPGERIFVHMESREGADTMLDATLALRRRPWNARTLRGVLLSHPLMTFRVIAAIYWQALRLWWKRCPFVPHPRAQGTSSDDPPDVADPVPDTHPERRPALGSKPHLGKARGPDRRTPVRT